MPPAKKKDYAFTVSNNTIQGPKFGAYNKKGVENAPKPPVRKARDRSYSFSNSQGYEATGHDDSSSSSPTSKSLLSPILGRGSEDRGQVGASGMAYNWPPFASTASIQSHLSSTTLNDSPYAYVSASLSKSSFYSDKYSLSPDPAFWGSEVSVDNIEADDYLHNPDPRRDRRFDNIGTVLTGRGLTNLGCLIVLCTGLISLFAGYPIITFFTKRPLSTLGGFNIGGINASGQIPSMPGNWELIDKDTPAEALTIPSYTGDGSRLELVFSDEFNEDGRSFYPGDDPYWEALDLHYWATNNIEWYDPEAVTTKDGYLEIALSKKETHNLHYQGGMLTSWNKFCFTGGLLQVSVSLPGNTNTVGLWPAIWTMGNLGRAGYGASLEGMWPYTYDSCDIGTVANQSINGLPAVALENGDPYHDDLLSFLPGQRLSRCTCVGESHPGPMHDDGTFVGRSSPEIDIFEAQVTAQNDGDPLKGFVSQSAQWAPFNAGYEWYNTTDNMKIADASVSIYNAYSGAVEQQATSVVTEINQGCYEGTQGCFSTYGFEYKPGFDGAYIAWVANDKLAWTLESAGLGADTRTEISARPVPQEPMYIIANLGMSLNFGGKVDLQHLPFPATMRIDYVRVYQRPDQKNIGCDPKDFPTQAYINKYIEAYSNPNLTTWRDDYGQPFPKNKFLGEC